MKILTNYSVIVGQGITLFFYLNVQLYFHFEGVSGLPSTCVDVQHSGGGNGHYELDPRQDGHSITVYCDVTSAPITATIEHDQKVSIHVTDYEARGSYRDEVSALLDRYSVSNYRWCLCLFSRLLNLTSKKKIKDPRYWPFVRGIHWWPVDSPHTRTSVAESVSIW